MISTSKHFLSLGLGLLLIAACGKADTPAQTPPEEPQPKEWNPEKQGPSRNTSRVRIGIIGDSISTFKDWINPAYDTYYPKSKDGKTLNDVRYTWWYRLIIDKMPDATLDRNVSFSGSLVTRPENATTLKQKCNFVARADCFYDPDIIIIHGGTNDRQASTSSMVPLGEFDYNGDITQLDESQFRPAYIKMVRIMMDRYPGVKIVCIVNSVLYKTNADQAKNYSLLGSSIETIASHYGFPVVSLKDVTFETLDGLHPSMNGTVIIADAVYKVLEKENLLNYKRH